MVLRLLGPLAPLAPLDATKDQIRWVGHTSVVGSISAETELSTGQSDPLKPHYWGSQCP